MNKSPARKFAALAGVFALVGLMSGCGGPPTATVSGTVTLDGKLVENGTIEFYPTGPGGPTAGGGIENGRYTVVASPGETRVVISATKVVGKHKMYDSPNSPSVDTVEQIIPTRYNKTSELKVTFKPGDNADVNFDLTTKKK